MKILQGALFLMAVTAASSDGESSVLMVVGGLPQSAYNNVELIDLQGRSNMSCSLAEFPMDEGGVGYFVSGDAYICGGHRPYNGNGVCYKYLKSNNWQVSNRLTWGRYGMAVLKKDEDSFFLAGGYDPDQKIEVKRIELYNTKINTMVVWGNLPVTLSNHFLFWINESTFCVAGGYLATDKSWCIDVTTKVWTSLPDMPSKRQLAQIGIATNSDGRKFVIRAGGSILGVVDEIYDTVEYLEYGAANPIWNDTGIPNLPKKLHAASVVPYNNSFVLVGGDSDNPFNGDSGTSSDIYYFNPDEWKWEEFPNKMNIGRYWMPTFFIDEKYVDCSTMPQKEKF